MSVHHAAVLKEWFKININEFEDFFSFMQESIKESEKKSAKRYEKIVNAMSEDEKQEFEAFSEDEFYQYSEYGRMLNGSFLVAIFSFLESAMNGICRNIGKIKEGAGIMIKLEDVNGTSIDRAKVYLNKIAGCSDSLFSSQAWQDVKTLQHIRNALVHNEGNIPKGDKGEALKRYITDKPDYFVHENIELDLDTYHNHIPILPKKEYCMFSLESIETFLDQLLQDIKWQ